ncbi:hypothetical protein PAECIP111893_01008 [Paenibacillus plantiphilus]|uniref:Flagellar hook-length control protein-like C-terminal domain-containing protein n=1 Tax=Paenibacillus plantiphilus TaxID=2905650 RepID=A0ABM9C0B7_9BACL|nr:flagellar hook-length control protein FliK [Paenibacillus plantiphilus]CAH1197848.1 hypothetical protein PAECIP111893_01008 [Paenibacillus plantiphilus]
MQMSISQATSGAAPAQPGGTPAAKSAAGASFGQTLVQTIAGSSVDSGQAQAAAEGAVPTTTANALTSLLGGNLTAADLIAAIEALLSKLDEAGTQEGEVSLSESDLESALEQLDNLLALLGAVPVIGQPVSPSTANAVDASEPTADPVHAEQAGKGLAIVQAAIQSAVVVQTSIAANAQSNELAVTNPQTVETLKSALQDALTDLRSFLQQGRSDVVNREQSAIIGKQLLAIKQVLDGNALNSTSTGADIVLNEETAAALRSMQAVVPASQSHLHRMAQQAFHVGLMSVVPTQEEAAAALEQVVEHPSTGAATQLAAGTQEAQRQIQTAKAPVIAQPVPVQQFAETMEGFVVKQFNVTTVNGVSEARITLFPEQLGQVDVRISVQNGQLTAMFVAETAVAKDLLENQLGQLRSALQSQGLQIDKLEVSNSSSVQPNLFQDRNGHNGREQQEAKRNKSKNDSVGEINGFDTGLEEVSIEQAVDRDMGFGRGINTMA